MGGQRCDKGSSPHCIMCTRRNSTRSEQLPAALRSSHSLQHAQLCSVIFPVLNSNPILSCYVSLPCREVCVCVHVCISGCCATFASGNGRRESRQPWRMTRLVLRLHALTALPKAPGAQPHTRAGHQGSVSQLRMTSQPRAALWKEAHVLQQRVQKGWVQMTQQPLFLQQSTKPQSPVTHLLTLVCPGSQP